MCCGSETPDLDIPNIERPKDDPMPDFGKTPTTNYGDTPFSKRLDEIMGSLSDTAGQYNDLNKSLIAKQRRFGSPAYAAEQIAAAKTDVGNAFAKQNAEADARDASLGLDPGNPRAYVGRRLRSIAEAGATAGAGTQARKGAEMMDWTTGMQLAGQGNNLTSQALQAGQIGGNQALEGRNLDVRQLMGNNDILSRIYMQGRDINSREYQQLRDLLYSQNRYKQDNEEDGWGGIGGTIGSIIGGIAFSSRRLKKNVKDVDGDEALEAARKMPAKKWRYLEGGPDNQEHVGPMAEDTAAAIGGNGVTIQPADVAGVALAATQALDRKVRRLEARK